LKLITRGWTGLNAVRRRDVQVSLAWKFSLRRITRQGSFWTAEACHGTKQQNVSGSGALRKNGIYLKGAANLMVKVFLGPLRTLSKAKLQLFQIELH
jgi:hypothetical protein